MSTRCGILRRQHVDELHRFGFFAARDQSYSTAVITAFSGLKQQAGFCAGSRASEPVTERSNMVAQERARRRASAEKSGKWSGRSGS